MTEQKKYSQWSSALHREFSAINYTYLDDLLPTPTIAVYPLKKAWATWCPQDQLITISSQLIEQYNWNVVTNILKHEIAHQYVDQFYTNRRPHGETFQRIAQKLMIPLYARGAHVDEAQLFQESINYEVKKTPEQERILRISHKLLALAEGSSNEHESAAAMKKVEELHRNHRVQTLNSQQDEYDVKDITHKKKRMERYQLYISSILVQFFHVKSLIYETYDSKELKSFRSLQICGKPIDISLAEYVYWFLYNNLWAMWKIKKGKHKGLQARNSFFLGVLAGFKDKLEIQKQKVDQTQKLTSDVQALVSLADQELEQYYRCLNPKIVTTGYSSATIGQELYDDGFKQGSHLDLHRPLKEKEDIRYIEGHSIT